MICTNPSVLPCGVVMVTTVYHKLHPEKHVYYFMLAVQCEPRPKVTMTVMCTNVQILAFVSLVAKLSRL